MITENTERQEKRILIKQLENQIHLLHVEREALEVELTQPIPWAQQTNFRVKLSPDAMLKVMLEDKALFDSIYSDPNILAEKIDQDIYVYLNFIYEPTEENPEVPAHQTLITNSGGIIEPLVQQDGNIGINV